MLQEFDGEAEDPDHSGESVDQQLANGGRGFVENFARVSTTRAAQLHVPVPDPGRAIRQESIQADHVQENSGS